MFGSMFARTFFIQAGWNYERFQNLGFAFSLKPALRRIYPDGEKFRAALLRHLQLFNTQPYMASFVLGNVAAIEEKAAAAPDTAAALKSMPGVKQALATSFASIGDRIFWGRLKPMTVQICLLVWAAGGFYGWLFPGRNSAAPAWLLLAGPLAGIVFYSAFSVYWRWKGLEAGYRCGGSAACGLDCADWQRQIRLLSLAGFAMSLAIVACSFALLAAHNRGWAGWRGPALRFALPVTVLLLHRACRAYGRSVFFAAGLVLAASLLFFGLLGMEPVKLYL
jgi:mannose/fructose/N-acetylgalactosamine-specific phosphotransferase system component IID